MQYITIMVAGQPTVYHLVFTPKLPFPYCNLTEGFFLHMEVEGSQQAPHEQLPLLQAIDDVCNNITGDQSQAWICHTRRLFSKMFN